MIIGITGTLGAGKGTMVEHLVEKYNFHHYSARTFLTENLNARGEAINRDTMTAIANELREKHGPSYIAEELLKQAHQVGGNAVIDKR